MTLYLIDTDIIIYFIKGHDAVVNRFIDVSLTQLFISDITCAELYYGAYNSDYPEHNLKTVGGVIANINIAPLSTHASKIFGKLKADLKKKGELLADMDLLIAAVAIAGNYTLVTNNIKHFKRIKGLKIENWSKNQDRSKLKVTKH